MTYNPVCYNVIADVSTISLAVHNISTIESSLKSGLENIEKWFQETKMINNGDKIKAIIKISTKQKQTRYISMLNLDLFYECLKIRT